MSHPSKVCIGEFYRSGFRIDDFRRSCCFSASELRPAFAVGRLAEPMRLLQYRDLQFKDPKFQPILDRLKGTVSMSGKFVCSAALVTFKGREVALQGSVLTAGHCSDRGSVQIPLRDKTSAAPDAGEVFIA